MVTIQKTNTILYTVALEKQTEGDYAAIIPMLHKLIKENKTTRWYFKMHLLKDGYPSL